MGRLAKWFGIGAIALAIIGCAPEVKEIKDLTGDGIPDAMVSISYGMNNGNYLFMKNSDGTYTRAQEKEGKYFQTDNGERYFFDGEFFRKAGEFKQ